MEETIIITGGLGFIGSHICVELIEKGYNVIILDNLENSTEDVYRNILNITKSNVLNCQLHICDLRRKDDTHKLFNTMCTSIPITGIIHCAGKKAVNESIHNPLMYYNDNLSMTINMLECVEKYNIPNFIFSSSATVYGTANGNDILTEDSVIGVGITNPYGKTKYMQEEIIKDFAKKNKNTTFIILRYFNPVGAHKSGLIGENPNGIPNNLMPFILRVSANNNNIGWFNECYNVLTIYGKTYSTPDGTCQRDFIHVVDLAKAHVSVLDFNSKHNNNYWSFNVGTGNGTSVLDIVKAFKKYNNVKLEYVFGEKRTGDIPIVVCDCNKINTIVGWTPEYTLRDIVIDSWNFTK